MIDQSRVGLGRQRILLCYYITAAGDAAISLLRRIPAVYAISISKPIYTITLWSALGDYE